MNCIEHRTRLTTAERILDSVARIMRGTEERRGEVHRSNRGLLNGGNGMKMLECGCLRDTSNSQHSDVCGEESRGEVENPLPKEDIENSEDPR